MRYLQLAGKYLSMFVGAFGMVSIATIMSWPVLPTFAQQSLNDLQKKWFTVNTCPYIKLNRKGADPTPGEARPNVVVGATKVKIMDADPNRCQAFFLNVLFDDMNCAPEPEGDPTATNGFTVYAGLGLTLDTQAGEAWWCIRSSSATADTAASVAEVYATR